MEPQVGTLWSRLGAKEQQVETGAKLRNFGLVSSAKGREMRHGATDDPNAHFDNSARQWVNKLWKLGERKLYAR